MDLGALFLIIAVALLAAANVARPFLRFHGADEAQAAKPADHLHSELLAERDRLLSAIREDLPCLMLP